MDDTRAGSQVGSALEQFRSLSQGLYERLQEETLRLQREAEEAVQETLRRAEQQAAEILREAEETRSRARAEAEREAEEVRARVRAEVAELRQRAGETAERARELAARIGEVASEFERLLARLDESASAFTAAGAPAAAGWSESGLSADLGVPASSAAAAEPAYVPEQEAPVAVAAAEPRTVEVAIAPSVPLPALHMLERILGELSLAPISLAPDNGNDEVRMLVTTDDPGGLVRRLEALGRFDIAVEDAAGRMVVVVEGKRSG